MAGSSPEDSENRLIIYISQEAQLMIRLNGGEMRERLEKLLQETQEDQIKPKRTVKKDEKVS